MERPKRLGFQILSKFTSFSLILAPDFVLADFVSAKFQFSIKTFSSDWFGFLMLSNIGVQHRVSKGVEDGRRLSTLRASHSRNGHKAVSWVAHPQGVEGLGMAGQGETLGSP
jgi:hypothetical protein